MEHFNLEPLPVEGGYFIQSWRSELVIPMSAMGYPEDKPAGTCIYYLFTSQDDSFSAMHTLPSTEIFHFYLGDPVTMLLLYEDGRNEVVTLGQDVLNGQHVQYVVPRGVWQGSVLTYGGDYALVGTTMAPGFTSSDYVGGDRDSLTKCYPAAVDLITRLTHPEEPLSMPEEL